MKGLGRREQYDPRSLRFGAKLAVNLTRPMKTKLWDCNLLLDQKQHSSCVGCAWTYELASSPSPVRGLTYRYALYQLYYHATCLDEFSGNDRNPNGGTSMLAGAKAVRLRGYCQHYHWANGVEEIGRVLSYDGPVVLGLPWWADMERVDSEGYLRPKFTAKPVGGHAILARGVDIDRGRFTLRNSWGKWGINGGGDCYLSLEDCQRLLDYNGEACFPLRRAPAKLRPVYVEGYPR